MFDNSTFAASELSVHPANASDMPFLERLYRSTRPELQQLDATPGQIETLVAQQYDVLRTGAAVQFPTPCISLSNEQQSVSAG